MKKTDLSVSLSGMNDETSAVCQYVCPSSHYLESWGDAEPVHGNYSLQQPLINPGFQYAAMGGIPDALVWKPGQLCRITCKAYWQGICFRRQEEKKRFYDFWVSTLAKWCF